MESSVRHTAECVKLREMLIKKKTEDENEKISSSYLYLLVFEIEAVFKT